MVPFKRMRRPKMTTQALLDFDLDESSSDDSDFRVPDVEENSSDDGDNSSDDDENSSVSEDDEADEGASGSNSEDELKQLLNADDNEMGTQTAANGDDDLEAMLKQLNNRKEETSKLPTKSICCVCLGDRSDEINEIIECDGCGVSVHEGCYGVSDNVSISSTNSTCSTEPWFCEACRAGVSEPICELCPNKGGIYKETDVGRWVHLVCALYVPGVAFGEVDQLSSVTLFEMQYSKWGAKVCSLCENSRFARVGVCIGCDAGMCKTYFHVTCAQAAGFLTEAHHEEAEAADPFYAHCKLHSEKEMIKRRKRNFHTFRINMQQKHKEKIASSKLEDPCPAQMRIQRKLLKYQQKYATHKQLRADPWVPTQKMSRLLTTSASACKRLLAKADVIAVDVKLLEQQENQIASLTDIRKKWHIPPAFSVEFIGYYLDRISRSKELKQQLSDMMDSNRCLTKEQDTLRSDYDALLEKNNEVKKNQASLTSTIEQLHRQLIALCPSKTLPNVANIGGGQQEPPKIATPPSRPISVPTAAALKMGVGFPLAHLGPPGSKVDSTRLLSTHAKNSPSAAPTASSAPSTPTLGVHTFDCGICKRCNDQHLLAKCDTCQLHYHLGCLNPPLTRHPKKSKLYGWQCSECDKSDESECVPDLPKGPRKSRTRFNKDGMIVPVKHMDQLSEADFKSARLATRRSLDNALSTPAGKITVGKKLVTKPLPAPAEATSTNSNKGTTPLLGKRSRVQQGNLVSTVVNMTESTSPTVKKSKQGSVGGTSLPMEAVLPPDEPLIMVISQTPTGPVEAISLPECHVSTLPDLPLEDLDQSKHTRKQKRKGKHKSKHNLSSDTDKSPSKEHKRKRKKKLHHDHSGGKNLIESTDVGIPKIKIKFKTLPLPGEVTPEAQFFYVPADMVRSAEGSRPSSVETVEDIEDPVIEEPTSFGVATKSNMSIPHMKPICTPTPTIRKISPRKSNQQFNSAGSGRQKSTTNITKTQNLLCCVCSVGGISTNVVTCDECRKHFHFTCLDPPLKKTPKIRGYSWHCAECDPTDDEHK